MKTVVVALLAVQLYLVYGLEQCQEVTGVEPKTNYYLPDVFTVNVEAVYTEQKRVKNMKMFYHKQMNQIRLDVLDERVKTSLYYNFNDNQLLTIDYGRGRGLCSVKTLTGSVDDLLIGGVGDKSVIPSPLAVFHFMGKSGIMDHQIKHKDLGPSNTRDKPSHAYSSCQKFTSTNNDILLNVTHYFAEPQIVFPASQSVSKLLRIDVEGKGTVKGLKDISVADTYNYFGLDAHIKPDNTVLQTPSGIYCKGRKSTKTWKAPNHIRFTSENVDNYQGFYVITKEMYDYENKLAIYQTPIDKNTDKDLGRKMMIMDFESGMQYSIDTVNNIGIKLPLNRTKQNMPFFTRQGATVSMDKPERFFMAAPKDFQYIGQQKIRGMWTDAYVANTQDVPERKNAVIQWNFAPPVKSWNDKNQDYLTNKWPYPVQFKLWVDDISTRPLIQNMFHVDYNPLRPDYIDISSCFNKVAYFVLRLKGSRQDILSTDLEAFKMEARTKLATILKIKWIYINKMKISFTNDDIALEFVIVGEGLDSLVDRMKDAVQSQSLGFMANGKHVPVEMMQGGIGVQDQGQGRVTKPGPAGDDDGYSGGAMAGVGIAMVLVGMAGGAGAGFAHNRYTMGA